MNIKSGHLSLHIILGTSEFSNVDISICVSSFVPSLCSLKTYGPRILEMNLI